MEKMIPRSRKERHADRHRLFMGQKTMSTLDKIMEMRFHVTFDSKVTTSDISNYKIVDEEWERYQLHLTDNAVMIASLEAFALVSNFKPVPTGEYIPAVNSLTEDIPLEACSMPTFVEVVHTENRGTHSVLYGYPDQDSFEQLTELESDALCNRAGEVTATSSIHVSELNHSVIRHEEQCSDPLIMKQIGDILSHGGYLTCIDAASLSAAIGMSILSPTCRRPTVEEFMIKVHVNDDSYVLPQELLVREMRLKKQAAYQIGSYYNACSAVNTKVTSKSRFTKFCACAHIPFTALWRALENETFSHRYFMYYKVMASRLCRHA